MNSVITNNIISFLIILCMAIIIVKTHAFLIRMIDKASVKKSKKSYFEKFRLNIKKSDNEMKFFKTDLRSLIDECSYAELTSEELNKVIFSYNFYNDIYEKVLKDEKVSEQDFITFANLHVEYSKLVVLYRKKNKQEKEKIDELYNICKN